MRSLSPIYRCRLASPESAAAVRLVVRQFQSASAFISEGEALEALVLNSASHITLLNTVRAVGVKLASLIAVAERRELSPRQLDSLKECRAMLSHALVNSNSRSLKNAPSPSSCPPSPEDSRDEIPGGEEVVSQLESRESGQRGSEVGAVPGAILDMREVWTKRQAR